MKGKPHLFIDDIEYKHCSKCKQYYPLSNFSKDSRRKDGLVPSCKKCASETKKKSIAKNPEKYKEWDREYHLRNKEKHNEQSKKYYYDNKEERLAYSKEYKKANIEKVREWDREWKREHKDEVRARTYNYFHSDHWKEIRKKNNRIYYSSEKGKIQRQLYNNYRRAIVKGVDATFDMEQWKECKEYFDNKCAYCGEEKQKLTQDHFIPISKNGNHVVNNIIPCCKSCNSSKCNKPFEEWYPEQPFYSKRRENKILKYLNK